MKTRGFVSLVGIGSLALALGAGCMQSLSEQAKRDPNININKKTNDIKQFDPKVKQEITENRAHADDPLLGPVQMLKPTITKIDLLNLQHTLDLYNAAEGHYPKDYDEFMTKVVKAYDVKLAVLPPGWQYAYDVENHTVRIVSVPEAPAKGAPPAANGAPSAAKK
jgi:hypothetical protein